MGLAETLFSRETYSHFGNLIRKILYFAPDRTKSCTRTLKLRRYSVLFECNPKFDHILRFKQERMLVSLIHGFHRYTVLYCTVLCYTVLYSQLYCSPTTLNS